MDSGFLFVDKPKDWTSFDVCARLRKILGVKRVGHTGTLDPFATGLLIVAVGKATKLIPFLEKDRKTYVTKIKLGVTSDTLDPTGEMRECENVRIIDLRDIESALKEQFIGKIEQVPPKYSALKIDGKKMYELARAGREFEIKPRETEIYRAEVLSYEYPYLDIELEVSAGFYVRSFARDLAEELGTQGICWELRRTAIADIAVAGAYEEGDLKDGKKDDFVLIDPKDILKIPQVEIESGRMDDFQSGRAFEVDRTTEPLNNQTTEQPNEGAMMLVLCAGKSVGVGEMLHGKLQPRIVL